MIEMRSRVWYSQGMKDGYYAQDNTSDMQVQDLIKILTEQIEKMAEQIEKQSELIEKLYDKIEEKDAIIRKQQKMLFGRRSEKRKRSK